MSKIKFPKSSVVDCGSHNSYYYQVVKVETGFQVWLWQSVEEPFMYTEYSTKKSAIRNAMFAINNDKYFRFARDYANGIDSDF